jgi:hypothetical protein
MEFFERRISWLFYVSDLLSAVCDLPRACLSKNAPKGDFFRGNACAMEDYLLAAPRS